LIVLVLAMSPSSRLVAQQYQLGSISFHGNKTFSDGTLEDLMTLKETPGGFSQFLYRVSGKKIGGKPEYFDPGTLESDLVKLREFYVSEGFYQSSVMGSAQLDSSSQRMHVRIDITENKRSFIDSVVYRGLDSVPELVHTRITTDPVLKKGLPYQNTKDAAEIGRILNILADNGYPTAHFDAEHSGAYRFESTSNFLLTFAFVTGRQYTFDGIHVVVEPQRSDITDNIILRQLDFQQGELYSREKRISSERSLNRLGLFESALVEQALHRDTTASSIPINITVRPRVRNELSPELIVSNDNNAFNLGFGLGYTNRNFFGDGRILTASGRARTQSLSDILKGRSFRDPSVVGIADFEIQIVQPYLFTRTLGGKLSSALSAEKQSEYILSIFRNRLTLTNRFATYTTGLFEWTLARVNPEILPEARQDSLLILSTLQQEDQPQFNSILTFTLQRDKTNDPFSPTEGFFTSISVEESGILRNLTTSDRAHSLPFTQYYKATFLGRWYSDLSNSRFTILASKLKTGYQNKYGESKRLEVQIPLNERFFAGGSGSVRGWRARELGAMSTALLPFGGNFLFEGSLELRVNHFRGVGILNNVWMVYFLDLGNVWTDVVDVKPKEVAIAVGPGLRYETFFGPFRIDFGFRVYDPKGEINGNKWIWQKRLWAETLKNGIVHFGLGQAF
jgi:outer membrane protein insertion porin family